ncbi:MAG: hypothetical protein H7210_04935 [Pyrinomonadaceae bacterium]|nr:hypothetical protein [Phycisphaerales bacterium]
MKRATIVTLSAEIVHMDYDSEYYKNVAKAHPAWLAFQQALGSATAASAPIDWGPKPPFEDSDASQDSISSNSRLRPSDVCTSHSREASSCSRGVISVMLL